MIDPYRMVLVNIIASVLILGGALTYRYLYPKKDINLFVLLILISFLPLISMLRKGTYQSGDLSLHAIRTMSFYKILFTEHILPRWTPEFYAGYGDPYFSFSYFLPYFIASVFHLIGFSFLASLKLLLATSFISSGIMMLLFIKDELGENAGFTAAILYLFAPYHLVDMHFRVTIAESLSFVFLPLCLYIARKTLLKHSSKWFLLSSISIMLFILSHQVISSIFFPLMILYAIFLAIQEKVKAGNVLYYFLSIISGLLLSMFYWLPIVSEAQFTQQALNKQVIIFPSISQLLYSPWRYGFLFQGHKGELSYIIGYTQILVVLIGLYIFIKKRFDKKLNALFVFYASILIALLFLILPISKPIWDVLPLFKYFQLSSRLLVLVSLFTAVISAIVVKTIKKRRFMLILCSITILYTILNWGNRTTISTITDTTLTSENKIWPSLGKEVGLEPSSPVWANLNKDISNTKRTANIDVLSGTAIIKQSFRNSTHHTYDLNIKSNSAIIRENTLYFPGWILKVDNAQEPIDYKSKNNMGIITFKLQNGIHKIELAFIDNGIVKISNLVSLVTALLLVVYFIKSARITYFRRFLYFLHLN